jgi:hypothetical protein
VIWLYGICDRPELPPPAELEAVAAGELLGVFARERLPDGDAEALWAHEEVVEALMAQRTVLPARFGSTLEDERALRRLLEEREADLLAQLARVRGHVEYAVRVEELVPVSATSGRDYLLAKLANQQLDAPLAELASDVRRQIPRGADEILRGAYLVERGTDFPAAVERLDAAHAEHAFLCTGPWPPYSFVR